MNLELKKGGYVSDSAGLLISILLRYPEVGMINYDPEMKILRFTFVISEISTETEITDFKIGLNSCLRTYYFLKNENTKVNKIKYSVCENFTLLEIKRDVQTLSSQEIALIITVVKENFRDSLIIESSENIKKEDLADQEKLIGQMLESMRSTLPKIKLLAFREKGRVLVFNK